MGISEPASAYTGCRKFTRLSLRRDYSEDWWVAGARRKPVLRPGALVLGVPD